MDSSTSSFGPDNIVRRTKQIFARRAGSVDFGSRISLVRGEENASGGDSFRSLHIGSRDSDAHSPSRSSLHADVESTMVLKQRPSLRAIMRQKFAGSGLSLKKSGDINPVDSDSTSPSSYPEDSILIELADSTASLPLPSKRSRRQSRRSKKEAENTADLHAATGRYSEPSILPDTSSGGRQQHFRSSELGIRPEGAHKIQNHYGYGTQRQSEVGTRASRRNSLGLTVAMDGMRRYRERWVPKHQLEESAGSGDDKLAIVGKEFTGYDEFRASIEVPHGVHHLSLITEIPTSMFSTMPTEVEGPLYMKRRINWINSWSSRYVILAGKKIVVYASSATTTKKPKEQMKLTGETTITTVHSLDTSFSVQTPGEKSMCFRTTTIEDKLKWMCAIKKIVDTMAWWKSQKLGPVIGQGGCADIQLCQDVRTRHRYAMKVTKIGDNDKRRKAKREILVLMKVQRALNHPNISDMLFSFEEESKMYVGLPLYMGGDLFDYVKRRKYLSETVSALIMTQLLSSLEAIHSIGLAHLDVKPENIMFEYGDGSNTGSSSHRGSRESDNSTTTGSYKIKLIDFGLARDTKNGRVRIDSVNPVGSVGYISPEIWRDRNYSIAADVFAAGVTLFIMLGGYQPYNGRNTKITKTNTLFNRWDRCEGPAWRRVSYEAKDLIRKMLEPDPYLRLTAAEAMQHPWFKSRGLMREPSPWGRMTRLSC